MRVRVGNELQLRCDRCHTLLHAWVFSVPGRDSTIVPCYRAGQPMSYDANGVYCLQCALPSVVARSPQDASHDPP